MQQETLTKVLNRLKDSTNIEEKCIILTYINGFQGKNLPRVFTKIQYNELCKVVVDMISTADKKCHINTITGTFKIIVKEFTTRESVLYNYILQITERKKRLLFLEFVMVLDVVTQLFVLFNPKMLKFLQECVQSIQVKTIQSLIQAESSTQSKEQMLDTRFINAVIESLQKFYAHADSSRSFKVEVFHIFVLEKVAVLAYMGRTALRSLALKLLNVAIQKNLILYALSHYHCVWKKFKSQLEKQYCSEIFALVKADVFDWSDLWCIGIKALDTDFQIDGGLLNKLLKIIEWAFKSTNVDIKRQAFRNWKLVIDIFAADPQRLATSKCINFLCTPLIESSTKSEVIALAKIEVWWYLIVKVYPNISKFTHQLLEPFFHFCFGSLNNNSPSSKKPDLTLSPGKKFLKTKIAAIDALLQMVVVEEEDRFLIIPALEERALSALSQEDFFKCYKLLIHSFGEVVVMIAEIKEDDLPHKEKLCRILWTNLMHYALQYSSECQRKILKEMILAAGELMDHTKTSPMIGDFVIDFIIVELVEISDQLIYDDDTLVDFLLKLLACSVLQTAEEKHFDDIRVLINQAIMPNDTSAYHSSTLSFTKTVLSKIEEESARYVKPLSTAAMWGTLAELMTKYMIDGQMINEGGNTSCNFETITSLLSFPFKHSFWENKEQMMKAVDLWKNLYQQFDRKVKTVSGVAPNLIANILVKLMEESVSRNDGYCKFVIHSICGLIESTSFQLFPSNGQIPTIVLLLRNVTTFCFLQKDEEEIELALKAIGLLLSDVYRLNDAARTLSYLECLRPSLETMLKLSTADSIEAEILKTWDDFIIVIQNYANILSYKFFSLYYNSILCGLCHKNAEIAASTEIILDMQSQMKGDVRNLLSELEREARKNLEVSEPAVKKVKNC